MYRLGPYDQLVCGANVRIDGGKRGTVLSHSVADTGVVIHKVQITHKLDTTVRPMKWRTATGKWEGSYRFLVVEE